MVLPLLVPLPTRSNPRIRLKDLLLRITDADGGAAGSAIPFDGFVSFASSAAVVNTDFDRRKNGGAILSSIGIEIYVDAIQQDKWYMCENVVVSQLMRDVKSQS